MKRKRSTPRRREAPRFSTDDWEAATLSMLRRSGMRCEWCDRALGNQMERHHRIRRRDGGDRLSNLVALHTACHQYVHAHPDEARDRGFIVSALSDVDPQDVGVTIAGRTWWLDDLGNRHIAPRLIIP